MPPGTPYFSPAPRLLHLLHSFSHPKLCSIRESIHPIDSKRILKKPRYRYTCRPALVPRASETGRQPSRGFHEASVPTGTEAGAPPIGQRASIAFRVMFDCRDVLAVPGLLYLLNNVSYAKLGSIRKTIQPIDSSRFFK
jgi:hypothetical protein